MIAAYTGNLGTGKTYCLVARALGEHRHKRRIFTNMTVRWGEHFDDWRQLLGMHNALVIIDEAGSWFNARAWKDTPREVFSWMTQSRKQGLSLWYTCQHLSMVDKTLRLLTNIEFRHERWFGNLIRERAYEPGSGEHCGTRWFRINPRVYKAYDTLEVMGAGTGDASHRGLANGVARVDVDSVVASGGRDDVWVREEAERNLVRECTGAVVRYRRATPWDVVNGADLVPRILARDL